MRRGILTLGFALVASTGAGAQTTGQISGKVTDEGGRPLSGVTVGVVGTLRGAVTASSGVYTITDIPAGRHPIRARAIGYTVETDTVTVAAAGSVTLDFQLRLAPVQLEGIVVTGYGQQERRDLTGAISSVRSTELRDVPTSNPMQALQARVPGVEISNANYRPGASMNVRIRGIRSMTATNEPLFVVDGVPIAGGIEDFNPNAIESIEVLKDATATAVYGSRGSNGVILVTTKAGTARKTEISFDSYYGMSRPLHLVDMMDAAQYAAAKREAWRAAARDTTNAVVFNAKELPQVLSGTGTDWQRLVLRTGRQQDQQVSINTYSGATRLAFTGHYFKQDGITIQQGYDVYSGTLTLDHTTGRLRIGMTASGSRAIADIGPSDELWGIALANEPLGVPYDSNGVAQFKPTDDPLLSSPITQSQNFVRQVTRNRLFGSMFSELRLAEGLTWRVNFGPDLTTTMDGEFHGQFTQERNGGTPEASRTDNETFAYTLDNILSLHRTVGRHRFDVTGLYGIQKQHFTSTTAAAQDLPYEQQLWYNLGTGGVRSNLQTSLSEWALESFMGRVNYGFKDRYLLTVTGRYDGSSRLAPGSKWAFFPSVGLGWQLGDEGFVRNLNLFNTLKVRGSWGRTGNTGINPYQTEGSLNRTRYNFGANGAFGYAPGQIPNPDLQWEKSDQYDAGLEFGVLSNRLSGVVDWYRQNTHDLLLTRALPPTSGFTQTLQNIGETRNTGIEVGLSAIVLNSARGLRWSVDLNATHNRNEIVSLYGMTKDSLGNPARDIGNFWWVGQPVNVGGSLNSDGLRRVYYDYEFIGIWQTPDSALARAFGQKPGDIRVKDQDGNGVINGNDRVILGNSYPKWTGSVYPRLSYGRFDLSALWEFRFGYKLYDDFGVTNSPLAGRYNSLDQDYWTPTHPSNGAPRPNAGRENPLYNTARGYLDAGHSRIRNVTVSYLLPERIVDRWGMHEVRVYGTAQDPYVFTDYGGYDPVNGTSGTPPSYRTFLFGAHVSF